MRNIPYITWLFGMLLFSGCQTKDKFFKGEGLEFSWKESLYEEEPFYELTIQNNTSKTLILPYSYYGKNYGAEQDALVKSIITDAYVHPPGTLYIAYELDTVFFKIHTPNEKIEANTTRTFYLHFCGIGNKSAYGEELLNLLTEKGTMYLDYIPEYFRKIPMRYKLIPPQKIGLAKKE